jgi:hypothetical protein
MKPMADYVVTSLNGKLSHAIEFFPHLKRRANGELDTVSLGKEVLRITLHGEDEHLDLDELVKKYEPDHEPTTPRPSR